MAHILIDGYNLIGTAHGNLEKARNNLVQKLQSYSNIRGHDITLVFDGWKNGQKDETKIKTAHLTVLYSRLGETADLVIKRILKTTTTPWIVVSTDREITDYAVRNRFAAVTSGEFHEKCRIALQSLGEDPLPDSNRKEEGFMEYNEDDDEYLAAPRKGNPKKLSKRDKMKIQALRTL